MNANTHARRENSRLEVDDRYHCKWCGAELPKMMVDGPIAGEGTEFEAVELCGDCKGKQVLAAARGEADE